MTDTKFEELGLDENVLKAVQNAGYDNPSPIQEQMIPYMLKGGDVLGQAQTGTGKTAAFALPILSKIDTKKKKPQVLVLAPTRELAIQVAQSFQAYSKFLKNFHILPIYGGQDYGIQLRGLKRNPQIIVGTPGRVMDHIKKKTLVIDELATMVLDEADEMLNMGFIDDIKWILKHTPDDRQIALFSATMPNEIKKISKQYLKDPQHIIIKMKTATADTINQRFWMVSGLHKIDALTRILEVEKYDGVLIFVRTKSMTTQLADNLSARGLAASALNGDMNQTQREKMVNQLKKGKIDILIGTDIVARGLDIDRITHVINYDIPYDTESYIHRIGRTGRAGKTGEAILFVAPRERNLLRAIEKATNKPIQRMNLPSVKDINDTRVLRFKQKITDVLNQNSLESYTDIVQSYQDEFNIPGIEIAAALAKIASGADPIELKDVKEQSVSYDHSGDIVATIKDGFKRYRISVGSKDGVKTGNIVGALVNEGKLDGDEISKIEIYDIFSTVDLPDDLVQDRVEELSAIRINGRKLDLKEPNESEMKAKSRSKRRTKDERGGRGRDRGGRGDRNSRSSRGDRNSRSSRSRKNDDHGNWRDNDNSSSSDRSRNNRRR
ncbi:MAG: ATP-dependent RNA helicase [Campylobacteraceae bacterium 4484_166]|nr:MAG: ATP-dependent RNA helicase [Campylobacteraceae bacterium 4484_166]